MNVCSSVSFRKDQRFFVSLNFLEKLTNLTYKTDNGSDQVFLVPDQALDIEVIRPDVTCLIWHSRWTLFCFVNFGQTYKTTFDKVFNNK